MLYLMHTAKQDDHYAGGQARVGADRVGHLQADKAESAFVRLLRGNFGRGGLDSVGIAKIMRAANLKHGGFYGHFPSRAGLIAAALERALHGFAGRDMFVEYCGPGIDLAALPVSKGLPCSCARKAKDLKLLQGPFRAKAIY